MQRTRVVNVHKEPCDICIMRPGIYQNQYIIGVHGTQEECVEKFRKYFRERIVNDTTYLKAVLKLKGKKIGCCHDSKPCHGDIYVEFLEREGEWGMNYSNEMKRIIIIGSRRRNTKEDFLKVEQQLACIYDERDVIVSGGCSKGGDYFAEELSAKYNISIIIFPAEWKRYGRGAGFIRNTIIAQNGDIVIACVAADRTGGTEDTIKKFKKFKPDGKIILC